jgi:toxin-antitoxin system PIN domain toxin
LIVPDVNLLLHAHDRGSRVHRAARDWWSELMNGDRPVGLPWAVSLGFIRNTTHPAYVGRPVAVGVACGLVRSWLERPNVAILQPGERHAPLLFNLLESLGTAGNLTTDAHLAALAIEHQAELHSSDADFARFAGLRWKNPLRD